MSKSTLVKLRDQEQKLEAKLAAVRIKIAEYQNDIAVQRLSKNRRPKVRAARCAAVWIARSQGFPLLAINKAFRHGENWASSVLASPVSIDVNSIIALATNTRPRIFERDTLRFDTL